MRQWRRKLRLRLALMLSAAVQQCATFSTARCLLGPARGRAATTCLQPTARRTLSSCVNSGHQDSALWAPGLTGDVDPPLARLLLHATRDVPGFDLGCVASAVSGLNVWQAVLQRGRLPVAADFGDGGQWPQDPLFSRFITVLADLELPRFVLRHPETAGAVLLSMVQLTILFSEQSQLTPQQQAHETLLPEINNKLDTEEDASLSDLGPEKLSPEDLEALADQVTEAMAEQWGGVIGGVHTLDQLFGLQHGLVDLAGQGGGGGGFGLQDGVWGHSGWRCLPRLQRKLSEMKELREIVSLLGRRPAARGANVHKFAPQTASPDSPFGAQLDPAERTSVTGLTLSNSLSEMLPSEAVLLKSASPTLRRLFLAKRVESKLLSYQLAGWTDTPTKPQERPRYYTRLPSAPGGPIIVCLDTSWSMTGEREQLSKAVVLACVTAAHRQKRKCQVVAFSSENDVMDCGEIACDASGVRRLLDFLAHSFEGGTDVTGALKHAMITLGEESMAGADVLLVTDGELPNPPVSQKVMDSLHRLQQNSGLQVHGLLVGKPESQPLEKICTHTHNFLLQYDSLAAPSNVMSSSSTPRLPILAASHSSPSRLGGLLGGGALPFGRRTWSAVGVRGWGSGSASRDARVGRFMGCGAPTCLSAKGSVFSEESERMSGRAGDRRGSKGQKGGKGGGETGGKQGSNSRRARFEDDFWEEEEEEEATEEMVETDGEVQQEDMPGRRAGGDRPSESQRRADQMGETGGFQAEVDEAVAALRGAVALDLQARAWSPAELDRERHSDSSCFRYYPQLLAAVRRVSEGLVERDEEARLVVLGMVAQEHVLLLGPPGTGKSALGRRLSQLCGGAFFQRLLTRFSTPEEIFGPLSLRALENDQYRRCTEGYLPTASIAFLDEIFKANSAILNTLLTILNEREFDNGAGARESCPVRCVVGASNELPESDELDALYDRFLLRKEVLPVSDSALLQLLALPSPGASSTQSSGVGMDHSQTLYRDGGDGAELDGGMAMFAGALDAVANDLAAAANGVEVGGEVLVLLRDLRAYMREEFGVGVSDRRLVKAARLLRLSAASHGRRRVDALDCLLLQHLVWRQPEERSAVRAWLWERLTPGSTEDDSITQYRFLLNGLRQQAIATVRKTSGDVTGAAGARPADVAAIDALRSEVARLVSLLQQRAAHLARHKELLGAAAEHLWLDVDEARAATQLLLPKAQAASEQVEQALSDARGLEETLVAGSHAPPDRLRLAVIETLWAEEEPGQRFTEAELGMGMKEAKAKFDQETFRKWKRAKKKADSD